METKFIEVSQGGGGNWGKFCLGRWTPEEWARRSALPDADGQLLIAGRGWGPEHILVLDLQTGEGAFFRPGGLAAADLNKHRVWVCPMFEPMLVWLYDQDLSDLQALPSYVELPDAGFASAGYRRPGPDPHEESGLGEDEELRVKAAVEGVVGPVDGERGELSDADALIVGRAVVSALLEGRRDEVGRRMVTWVNDQSLESSEALRIALEAWESAVVIAAAADEARAIEDAR